MLISLLFMILAAGCTFTGSEEKFDEIEADRKQQSTAEKNDKEQISGTIQTKTLLPEDLEQIAETMSFSEGAFLTPLQMANLESAFGE